ncbi:MAG: nucleotidyl transferase AbiEii/AbiGii toxin family protein [Candidatus Sungbacteria bacterium]|nr:nucleotidyl transferase AbiEii/AbiGii toxin family protein [Candidatus Sungbacteria bacterium]
MEEIDPRHLLIKVAQILEQLDIPYAITGGMAVFVWARPRFTADIDIIILMAQRHIASLAEALQTLSEASYIDTAMMQRALERRGEFNFIDGVTGVKVDFFVIEGMPFDRSQLNRRMPQDILGNPVYFVSPEDLILSKLLWFQSGESAKQYEDIKSILRMQPKLDWKYLRKWAMIHKTTDILNRLQEKESS